MNLFFSSFSSHAQIAIDTVLSFRCAIGYKMYGPSQVKCTDKGQWSESFPRCECKYKNKKPTIRQINNRTQKLAKKLGESNCK